MTSRWLQRNFDNPWLMELNGSYRSVQHDKVSMLINGVLKINELVVATTAPVTFTCCLINIYLLNGIMFQLRTSHDIGQYTFHNFMQNQLLAETTFISPLS